MLVIANNPEVQRRDGLIILLPISPTVLRKLAPQPFALIVIVFGLDPRCLSMFFFHVSVVLLVQSCTYPKFKRLCQLSSSCLPCFIMRQLSLCFNHGGI